VFNSVLAEDILTVRMPKRRLKAAGVAQRGDSRGVNV
jgi:hypothetical protein